MKLVRRKGPHTLNILKSRHLESGYTLVPYPIVLLEEAHLLNATL